MLEQTPFWAAITTMVVWVAVTILSTVFMIAAEPDALGAAIFVVLMAAIGVGATVAGWEAVGQIQRGAGAESRRESGKAKRRQSSRVARLIDDLNADEIVELETLLLAREQDYPER